MENYFIKSEIERLQFLPYDELKLLQEKLEQALKEVKAETEKRDKLSSGKLSNIEERFYDANGKLCGMSILVESGKLPLTGEQYAQWRIEELKKND